MTLLQGKTAIVTGAGAGSGLAIARRLASEGARVVIAERDPARAGQAAEDIAAAGGEAVAVEVDIAEIASIDRMVAQVATRFGRIDILVNNAGVSRKIPLLELTPEDWDWIQSVNTRGTFFCLQRVASRMKETGGGCIVNIASIAGKGLRGASNASYSASKAAIIGIGRSAAMELGPFGIRVNTVCPGLTRTELAEEMERSVPGFLTHRSAESALGRVSEPDDIATAVLFLCSELSRNVTGQSLNVDGGTVWD